MTTQTAEQPRTDNRRPWLIMGLLTAVLGVLALVSSAPLVLLADAGWPWHASISHVADGRTTAEVVEPNGKTSEFTGSPAEAQAWLDRKQTDLKDTYGFTTQVAVGQALSKAGMVLLALGVALLAWRLAANRAARRSPVPTDPPSAPGG